MHTLLAVLERSDEFRTILAGLAAHGDRLCIEGASGAGKSLLIAGIVRHSQGPALVIAHNEEHATRLFDDLTALFEDDPAVPVLRYPSIGTVRCITALTPATTMVRFPWASRSRAARRSPSVVRSAGIPS